MSGIAPEELSPCWTCGGDWEDCRHGETPDTTEALGDRG